MLVAAVGPLSGVKAETTLGQPAERAWSLEHLPISTPYNFNTRNVRINQRNSLWPRITSTLKQKRFNLKKKKQKKTGQYVTV